MVLLGFCSDGLSNQRFDMLQIAALSKGCFKIHFVVGKEARPELAVCREPEAVAGRAKMSA